jgi:alkanesulfonate monooxygenase SsuD/methylene tetrahydromethanopterin reductase-like flavin-dependent oxidoreductase (luciferase family)
MSEALLILRCTTTIGFSTEMMIRPQRQTALVAKQAASLDVLSLGQVPLRHWCWLESRRIRRLE